MAATTTPPKQLTQAQAQAITTAVLGESSPALGNFPWPRLDAALGVKTPAQGRALAAQALRQTGHSDQQISSILTLPHGTNITALIKQDLIGALLAFGAGAVGAGAGAAGDAAAGGAAAATGGDAAAGGAGAGAGAAGTVAKVAAVGGLAGALGGSGWSELLIRALEALAALALLALGLQALTGVDATGTAAKAAGAAAVA
jgi:hypothetical protein